MRKSRLPSWRRALTRSNGEDDYPAIRKAIDELNQGTMRLAELMMDAAVGAALSGKNMDEADMGEGPDCRHPMAKAEFE